MTSEVSILNGYSAIVNMDNVKPGIDIKELEAKMISGGLIHKVKDPQDRFNEVMRETSQRLGINFSDFAKKEPEPAPRKQSPPRSSGFSSKSQARSPSPSSSESDNDSDRDQSSPRASPTRSSPTRPARSSPPRSSGDISAQSGSGTNNDRSSPPPRLSDSWKPRSNPYSGTMYNDGSTSYARDDLASRTQEQERREHIKSINAEMGINSSFSFEKEKKEDIKCQMLEEIDSLINSLQEEDADLSRIPKVDRNSSFEEVEAVLKMLRHKNDRSRYCSFAEEFLLFGAYGLEELFDGKRTWLGRYRPDLTGWHNNVNVKLRRMRHDTSTLVSSIMQDYNIGPGARLLLELVPNMVLYSKTRQQQHGETSIYSDADMVTATNRLREFGEPKSN